MIRPDAAARRWAKHERMLREIRAKNLAVENTAFIIESVEQFSPEKAIDLSGMTLIEMMKELASSGCIVESRKAARDAKIVEMIAETIDEGVQLADQYLTIERERAVIAETARAVLAKLRAEGVVR